MPGGRAVQRRREEADEAGGQRQRHHDAGGHGERQRPGAAVGLVDPLAHLAEHDRADEPDGDERRPDELASLQRPPSPSTR